MQPNSALEPNRRCFDDGLTPGVPGFYSLATNCAKTKVIEIGETTSAAFAPNGKTAVL
jgi:hypothetical protein